MVHRKVNPRTRELIFFFHKSFICCRESGGAQSCLPSTNRKRLPAELLYQSKTCAPRYERRHYRPAEKTKTMLTSPIGGHKKGPITLCILQNNAGSTFLSLIIPKGNNRGELHTESCTKTQKCGARAPGVGVGGKGAASIRIHAPNNPLLFTSDLRISHSKAIDENFSRKELIH